MSPILIGLVLFGVLMLLLALFAGRGAGETWVGTRKALDLTLPELARALREVFTARGFIVVAEVEEPGRADMVLRDASPLTGQTISLRCVVPPDGAPVDSLEVQAALDRVRGEQLEKAIVATPGEFTQEAKLLARGANVELLDGPALELLLGPGERRAAGPPVRAS
jgi:hypothetical protein